MRLKLSIISAVFLFAALFTFSSATLASDESGFPGSIGRGEETGPVPAPLLFLGEGTRAVIVDKNTNILYLYNGAKLTGSYRVTLGKKRGDKKREGDLKTPEGIYFFTGKIEKKELQAQYGALALTTNYPNPVDRLNGKTGTNIWLHATDNPGRVLNPNTSRGCVVGTDADVLEIASQVEFPDTPIIIVDRLEFHSSRQAGLELKSLLTDHPELKKLSKKNKKLKILRHGLIAVVSYRTEGTVKYLYLKRGGLSGGGPWKNWEPVAEIEEPLVGTTSLSAAAKRTVNKKNRD